MGNFKVQTSFGKYQQNFYAGMPSRGNSMIDEFVTGVLDLGSGTRAVRPGEPVMWNSTSKKFNPITSAATQLDLMGVVTYDYNHDTNSSGMIEFGDESTITVMLHGTIVLKVGEAVNFYDRLQYDHSDHDWTVENSPVLAAGTTVNLAAVNAIAKAFKRVPIYCVTKEGGAANGLVEARIGSRVY